MVTNERVKIKSDIPVRTDLRIDHNKPDLMIHDLRTKEITLVEVGITNKDILARVEQEKTLKYQLLANELKCLYPGSTVTIIPVVMTWDGLVTRHFKHYMKQLEVKPRLLAYMQSVVLKKTCESIISTCRDPRNDWLEEEASELMAQLEISSAGTDENVAL